MDDYFETKNKNQILGLVYDLPIKLKNSNKMIFPDDASAEWESQSTIDKIIETWKQLGFSIILFPLDSTFLKKWSELSSQCTLVHSLVEGWGSLARESWIPALCELSGVPFIGSDPFAHSICMSKTQTKLLCQFLKIPVLPFYTIKNLDEITNIPREFFKETHFIKPDGEGSGMGIEANHSISSSKTKTEKIIKELLENYPDGILIEKYIDGPEYTSAMINTPPQFLPIAQIEVPTGVYGLSNKSKEIMGEKVTFPEINKKNEKIIKTGTEKLFYFLQLKDFVRVDWRCDSKGNVFFLEANTLPGLSFHYSVLPMMAQQIEISYRDFFSNLAQSALQRTNSRNLWYGKTRITNKNSQLQK